MYEKRQKKVRVKLNFSVAALQMKLNKIELIWTKVTKKRQKDRKEERQKDRKTERKKDRKDWYKNTRVQEYKDARKKYERMPE